MEIVKIKLGCTSAVMIAAKGGYWLPEGIWPGETIESLFEIFYETGDRKVTNVLLHNIDAARWEIWNKTVENMNFGCYSRKAWSLLKRLGGGSAHDTRRFSHCGNIKSYTRPTI